jgi:hypothetical protein
VINCLCLAESPPDALSGWVGWVMCAYAAETAWPSGVYAHARHAWSAIAPSAITASIAPLSKIAFSQRAR